MTHSPHRVYREITPASGFTRQDLRELWAYRGLIQLLAIRDIKVHYKQTILGPVWAIIQPLVLMVVFTFIFGNLAKLPTDGGLPHTVFIFSGLLPWMFFSTGLSKATTSLVSNSGLLTKVYFPRLSLVLISVVSGIVDFGLSLAILLVMMAAYGIYPPIHVIILPFWLVLAGLLALGLGLWFSALNVRIRDVGLGISFFLRIWLYLTPVAYASSVLPRPFDTLYVLNPMAAVVEGFRWSLLGTSQLSVTSIIFAFVMAIALLLSGTVYFKRVEAIFADVV